MKKLYALLVTGMVFFSCSSDNDDTYALDIDWPGTEFFGFGSDASFDMQLSGYSSVSITNPAGWTVTRNGDKISVSAPAAAGSGTETSGTIKVTAGEGSDALTSSMKVSSGLIVGFEDAGSAYLSVDEDGTNLYASYGESQYISYTDPASNLRLYLNDGYDYTTGDPSYDLWSGGSALSTWNIMTMDGYESSYTGNQCSVYYKDKGNGNGGNGGSKVFGVAYGMDNEYGGEGPSVDFGNGEEYTIDHMWITNTTYCAVSMEEGYKFARKLTYDKNDYFRVSFEGYDKNGNKTGEAVYYLADFRTAKSGGVVGEWIKADLSSLGKVNRVKFVFEGTDTGENGLNTPAYFCFDDVAIRR